MTCHMINSHGGILYVLMPNNLGHTFFRSSLHRSPPLVAASCLNEVTSTGSEDNEFNILLALTFSHSNKGKEKKKELKRGCEDKRNGWGRRREWTAITFEERRKILEKNLLIFRHFIFNNETCAPF